MSIARKMHFVRNVIKNDKKLLTNFGIDYASMDFCRNVILHGTQTKLGTKLDNYYYKKVESCFFDKDYYRKIVLTYKDAEVSNNKYIARDAPIWILWWQGIDNAPLVVKQCIRSIKANAENHVIHFIDRNNYFEFCSIPPYIIDKLNKGLITLTHFSDILRLHLLSENGGIWMDATLFMYGSFPDNMYSKSFYTIKHGLYCDSICHGKWTGFFLACTQNNPLICFCRNLIDEYWKHEDALICYLLIDVTFSIAYNSFEWARSMIDNVPDNNKNVFWLQEHVNDRYENFDVKQRDNCMFKMSYKIHLSDNPNTYWNVIGRKEL